MLNVLLVDDEPIIRDMLKSLIVWEELGFQVVDEAWDGQQALNTIMNNPNIDIVVTDLKMPVMDGLELIRNAHSFNPKIKFVVLSAYDEFNLVKTAFKLGAIEYILKAEMRPKYLVDTFKKVASVLEQEMKAQESVLQQKQKEWEQQQKFEAMEYNYFLNQEIIKEKLLKELIWGNHDTAGFKTEIADNLRFNRNSNYIRLMVLKINNYTKLEKHDWLGDKELLNFGIKNVINEILDRYQHGDSLQTIPGEFVILFSFDHITSNSQIHEFLVTIFAQLSQSIQKCFNVTLSSGISNIDKGSENLKELYEQALAACQYSFIGGNGRMFDYSALSVSSGSCAIQTAEKVHYLKCYLKIGAAVDVQELSSMLCITEKEVSLKYVNEAKALYEKYYHYIADFIEQNNFDSLRTLLNEYEAYLQDYGNLKELNEWLKKVIQKLATVISHNCSLTEKIKKYLETNYQHDISLYSLAEHFNLSQGHLSRIFNKELKSSFADYIARVRIEAAIRLVNQSNLKLYEVAEKVGFSSAEHFSRTFKKVTGKSAKEYFNFK